MLTRRDVGVALIAICTTLSFVALARQEKLLMGSTVFDWNTIEAKPTKVGSVRNFFRAPTATLDELECHVTTLNAGEASHAPHQHPDEEIVIVREGTLEVFFNGQTQKAGPGSVIFLASNQMHGVRNIGTSAASYHVIRWNSPGMLKAKSK